MRRATAVGILALLFAGCVMTPEKVRKDGRIYTLASTLPPSRAAACIARAFESAREHLDLIDGWHTASIRDGAQPSTIEVLVDVKLGQGFRHTYIDVAPAPGGSAARIAFQLRVTPDYLQEQMFALLKKRCAEGER